MPSKDEAIQTEIRRSEKFLALIEANLAPEELRRARTMLDAKYQRARERQAQNQHSI